MGVLVCALLKDGIAIATGPVIRRVRSRAVDHEKFAGLMRLDEEDLIQKPSAPGALVVSRGGNNDVVKNAEVWAVFRMVAVHAGHGDDKGQSFATLSAIDVFERELPAIFIFQIVDEVEKLLGVGSELSHAGDFRRERLHFLVLLRPNAGLMAKPLGELFSLVLLKIRLIEEHDPARCERSTEVQYLD